MRSDLTTDVFLSSEFILLLGSLSVHRSVRVKTALRSSSVQTDDREAAQNEKSCDALNINTSANIHGLRRFALRSNSIYQIRAELKLVRQAGVYVHLFVHNKLRISLNF